MERAGVKINADFLKLMSKKLGSYMADIERTIYELAGMEFNINSPKQLAEILFVKLKLTPTKKTKTGFSTNVDVLEDLAPLHPLPAEILKFRTLSKLKSTYIDALPLMINPKTGRLHTSLNQRTEPPEHPHTHRSGAGDQTGVHRRTRCEPDLRRLLPDRAARPRPHE
jgi:DNA polymerase-1